VDSPGRSRDQRTDWGEIFDLIASEYGYGWEKFTGLTYKQLHAWLGAIAKRTHNQLVVLAAMHGLKMDLYRQLKAPSKQILADADVEIYKQLKEKQRKKAVRNGKRQ